MIYADLCVCFVWLLLLVMCFILFVLEVGVFIWCVVVRLFVCFGFKLVSVTI